MKTGTSTASAIALAAGEFRRFLVEERLGCDLVVLRHLRHRLEVEGRVEHRVGSAGVEFSAEVTPANRL